jgi:hypothetical protein
VLDQGDPAERKRVVRACVQEMKPAPERLEVEITYRLPEPVMNGLVAGAWFVAVCTAARRLSTLPRNGRRHKPGIVRVTL